MITGYFITFIAFLVNWSFGLLPHVTEMPEWYDNIEVFFGIISAFNNIPVLGTILAILAIALPMVATWQTVVFANWIYNKIRGSG